MKHFLPSSVMLTPFVVKHYESEEDNNEEEQLSNTPQSENVEEEE